MLLEFYSHVLTVNSNEPEFEKWMTVLDELKEKGFIRATQFIKSIHSHPVNEQYGQRALPQTTPDTLQFNAIYQAFVLIKNGILLSVHYIDPRMSTAVDCQMFVKYNELYKDCVDTWTKNNLTPEPFHSSEDYLIS